MAYVKFELKDGSTVYIESTDLPKNVSGLIPPDKGAGHADAANVPFAAAIDTVSKMSAEMLDGLRAGFEEAPSDVSINFGLRASADMGGLFVARGGMDANFNVSLRWHKESKADKDEDSKEEPAKAEVLEEKKTKAKE
ncbi:MAG TPA: CU044_2847 family protein [Anaerolineaceae bacterium]